LKVRVILLSITACLAQGADTPTVPAPDRIVENYCAAVRGQNHRVKAATMEVDIAAALPKLKKQGKLHALRHITALGRITYEKLRFEGDGTVKSQVINRYLAAEAEAQAEGSEAVAVTPENYNFKYKGRRLLDGRDTHEFEVTPKHKRQVLFKGELWIDAQSYLRVQESGYLVKSPSVFLKRVEFVRKYEIRDGISVPKEEQSVVDTRLGVGKLEMTVEFSNYAVDAGAVAGEPNIQ
jgi:hypothetical protein